MSSLSDTYKFVSLARHAQGLPNDSNFKIEVAPLPKKEEIKDQEILVRVLYLSVDPYMRGRIGGEDHRTSSRSIVPGEVIPGATVGQVIFSNFNKLKPGDIVHAYSGWREYYVVNGSTVTLCDTKQNKLAFSLFTGSLGMTGLTAYYGLMKVIEPKKGETIVISAAAGAVGAMVGQIAKIIGCKVIGIAGGADKCKYLKEIGFDVAIDYKADSFKNDLNNALANGVDGYYDNVGGPITDLVIPRLNKFGRVAICGQISTYNQKEEESVGPRLFHHLIWKMAKIQGFLVQQWANENEQTIAQLSSWILSGELKCKEDIMEGGIEKAPQALLKLFDGTNFGKQSVHIADPVTL